MPEISQDIPRNIPRLVIAGTSSGVGKTTIVIGLVAALRAHGLTVQPFKCGPDYIDPSWHSRAAGRPSRNLDTWMLDDSQVAAIFERACTDADIAIIEGVMGLFDGSDFENDRASAAQIAKLLGAPVLLVLDISKSARSIAATARGFEQFDPGTRIAGFILNNAGSEPHATGCAAAIARHCKAPVIGWLPRDAALTVSERHLGLIHENEHHANASETLIQNACAEASKHFDLNAIVAMAERNMGVPPMNSASIPPVSLDNTNAPPVCSHSLTHPHLRSHPTSPPLAAPSPIFLPPTASPPAVPSPAVPPLAPPLLAVARDAAFCFHYPDNLTLLEAAGAQIAYFKPTCGERLPADAAGVYLGGGYPELHAKALSENTVLWNDLRAARARGLPIFAECGGFMTLTDALIDDQNHRWPMAGLVPGDTRMTKRLAGFGYRYATALKSNLLVAAGETLRAHEFHYSAWEHETPPRANNAEPSPPFAWMSCPSRKDAASTPCGYAGGNLLASYLHIHLGQRPALALRLVALMKNPHAGLSQ